MATCESCGAAVRLSRRDIETIDMMITMRLRQLQAPIGRDGIIQAGSYDPKDGTVRITYGDTATMFPDTSDEQLDHPRIPLLTPHYGEQSGPQGNERVVVLEAQGGPVALMLYDEDDSPGAPAGEKWVLHRKADGTTDHSSKWTNDGPTAGDGLGGQIHSGFALHSVETAGGLSTTHNDSTKQIKHSASASAYSVVDGETDSVSHVASEVGLGDLSSNLDAVQNAAQRYSDQVAFAKSIQKTMGDLAQQIAQALVAQNVPNAPAVFAMIQAGLPSLTFTDITSSVAGLEAPAGSSTVRIK